jgi:ankyrin repeat protein
VEVAAFLLDLGMSPDVEDPQQGQVRPLHWAAYYDSPRVGRLLIDRGAEIDFYDTIHDGTALWWAVWGQKPRMVDMLSPLSRDVWSLTVAGKVERLRAVLSAEPRLAKSTYQSQTPLFWLPDDEDSAAAIVELFLVHGADPALKNKEGLTAADCASQRGLEDAARLLRAKADETSRA